MRIELRAVPAREGAAGSAKPGRLVGELRQPLSGAQVPLPFALPAPDSALTLHAALFHDNLPIWISAAIAVPAGQGALDLGPLHLTRAHAMGFARWLICGTEVVQIGFARNSAVLRLGEQSRQLKPLIGAPGVMFADTQTPRSSVRPRGEAADVIWSGRALPPCLPFADPAQATLTARGNEPGWVLSLGPDGAAFSAEGGTGFRMAPLPDATPSPAACAIWPPPQPMTPPPPSTCCPACAATACQGCPIPLRCGSPFRTKP